MNLSDYEKNGYYFPITVISKCIISICNHLEKLVTANKTKISIIYSNPNYLIPDIYNITRSEIIISNVEKLIWKNILWWALSLTQATSGG